MAKKILFIIRKPPYCGAYAQETLDMAMTFAAFDQDVTLLLMDDAVFHINAGQRPEPAGFKNLAAAYDALPLYDINSLYVETESLVERGLTLINLCAPVTQLPRHKISEFCREFDAVFSG